MKEYLWSVGLLDTRTHNKLRLRVWAASAQEAEAKLTGVLIGDCCEYILRNTVQEPQMSFDPPVTREVSGND